MKLTHKKLLDTLGALNRGVSKYQACKIAGVSKQRLYQVWNEYQDTGKAPELGKQVGRPRRPISSQERIIVQESYLKYRVSADALERIIERDYNIHLSHNHIHSILLELGFAEKGKPGVKRKINWIRYERRHSLTAVHIDWHCRKNGLWVLAIIDDASRKMLVAIECDSPTLEYTILGMELALQHGPIRECISDHGSQFTNNQNGQSRFRNWLDAHGIKQILCRVKHPQSNGKIERWFYTYENNRDAFNTVEEFLNWYNNIRPHRSLNWDILETPNLAFERKKRAEV
jgi:putative transposase